MKDILSYKDEFSNNILDEKKNITITNDINRDFTNEVVNVKRDGLIFSRNVRGVIFIIILSTNLIINMDHGTIPSATTEIKQDRNIDDAALGIMGSLVYFGNLLGKVKNLIRGYDLYECNEKFKSKKCYNC